MLPRATRESNHELYLLATLELTRFFGQLPFKLLSLLNPSIQKFEEENSQGLSFKRWNFFLPEILFHLHLDLQTTEKSIRIGTSKCW